MLAKCSLGMQQNMRCTTSAFDESTCQEKQIVHEHAIRVSDLTVACMLDLVNASHNHRKQQYQYGLHWEPAFM